MLQLTRAKEASFAKLFPAGASLSPFDVPAHDSKGSAFREVIPGGAGLGRGGGGGGRGGGRGVGSESLDGDGGWSSDDGGAERRGKVGWRR